MGQSPKGTDDGLSFLRRQESSLFDYPGFRIKCGMTGLNARSTEYDYEKQTQFAAHRPESRSTSAFAGVNSPP